MPKRPAPPARRSRAPARRSQAPAPARAGRPSTRRPPARRADTARTVAFHALVEAERRRAFADAILRDGFESTSLSRPDRALATMLVQEALRRRGQLDYRLGQLLERGVRSLPVPVLEALRLGLVQLLHLDRIPPHAAVDETVRLVRDAGYDELVGLTNAILRRVASGDVPELPAGDDDASLAARHSFPVWLVRRWRRHGDRLISILEGSNRTPEVVLRVNHAATTRDRVLKALAASRVSCSASLLSDACIRVHGRLDLPEFPPFRRGEVSVQDESEALVAELVDPLPGERILDLCAAPGGKTCHLLERSQGMSRVVAMDSVRSRLVRVGENMLRIRLRAPLVVADGREPPFAERFDTVLVDAPCTGTGVLARRADARWRLEPEDPARCASLQAELLERAAAFVGVGGLLVYSVCSIEPEETTDLLERFLEAHPGFREEAVRALPQRARDPHGRLLILPGLEGCDGVFGVRLRRTA